MVIILKQAWTRYRFLLGFGDLRFSGGGGGSPRRMRRRRSARVRDRAPEFGARRQAKV